MDQELVKAEVLASEWGTTTGALAQMRYMGTGPKFIKIGGKAVRYRRSDVDAWLNAQTRQQTGTQSIPA
ncbi:hypothetical protein GCM10009582_04520 [Arthrobacter flavus]